jgi:hypothetical protein
MIKDQYYLNKKIQRLEAELLLRSINPIVGSDGKPIGMLCNLMKSDKIRQNSGTRNP